MIEEKKRTVSDNIIKTAFPSSLRERKIRDSFVLEFIDTNAIRTLDKTTFVYSIDDLIDVIIPNNAVASKGITYFHKFLMSSCNCRELFSKRKLSVYNYSIYLLDNFGSYFSFRKGNDWGSLYFIDEEIELPLLHSRVVNFLKEIRNTGWNIDRLMPPARMAENLIRQKININSLPNFSRGDIDKKTIDYAFSSLKGGRMEASCLGSFNNIYDFDYNSCHFSILRDLPAIRPGFVKYISSKKYCKDAILGFGLVHTIIDDNCPLGLIANRIALSDKEPRLYYTIGESISFRTKSELDFLLSTEYTKVEILDFVWIIPIREIVRPFRVISQILERLMDNNITYDFAKFIAATMWGKFCSQHGGPLWNIIYASEIAAQARIQVTKLGLSIPDSLIAIAVDGLATTKGLPNSLLSKEHVGGMKVRKYNRMISFSDYYRSSPRSDGNWEVTNDGIKLKDVKATIPYVLRMGGNSDDVGKVLVGAKIPFGSTKRKSPKHLSKYILETEQFRLKPPSDEEAVELYFSTGNNIPFDF